MFTNSIDAIDFFRKILAFSTQLIGSFSNSLSSKEKEIFDIDSPREVIERLTRGQSSNPLWFKYRQMTITGSKAHMLNNAAKKGVLSSYARKMLMGSQDPKELNVPPVIYGRNNEAVARNNFIARKTMIGGVEYLPGFTFQERGMYIDRNFPYIAASVDGLYSYFDTNVDHPHHDNNDTPKSQSCFPNESQHFLDSGFSINDENIKFSLMDNCFDNNHGFDSLGKRVTRLLEIKCPYVLRHIGLKKGIHKLSYLEPVVVVEKKAACPLQNQSLIQRRRRKKSFLKRGATDSTDDTSPSCSSNNADATKAEPNQNFAKLYRLKKSSLYYTQIQLYLRVYDLDVCTLLIWTPFDVLELDIKRDYSFGETLFANLSQLYWGKFVPTLDFQQQQQQQQQQ